MAFVMTKLHRSASGGFTARKGIPKDVRAEHQRLYGSGWEVRFSAESSISQTEAKSRFNDWLAQCENRIDGIRAAREGRGQSFSKRQVIALVGEWYNWYVHRYEDAPGRAERWESLLNDLQQEELTCAPEGFGGQEEDARAWRWLKAPNVRSHMRPVIADKAETAQFLAAKGLVLAEATREVFLDALEPELTAAIHQLILRAKGDYTPDARPQRFPKFEPANTGKSTGFSFMDVFELWINSSKPGTATVNRWRTVFLSLDFHFAGRPLETITIDDISAWSTGLITKKRTAQTVSEIWLSAATTVFNWALKQRVVAVNPFKGVSVTVPKKLRTRETNAFRNDEIQLILMASMSVKKQITPFSAACRWVPWLCAYSGARSGEITQLGCEDILHREGIYALQITPSAGTTKTGQTRIVPIHEHILEQGFIDFVKSRGKGPLFYKFEELPKLSPDKTNPRRPRAVKARERLAGWIREQGLTDREIRPNHGWRHTFKQIADRHHITERVSDEITGHKQMTVGRGYGRPTLADMATALKLFPRYILD